MSILPRPNLPALSCLVGEDRAPLRIALVNLMPNKRHTETQFARVLSGHRRAVELTLVLPDCYESTRIGADYLQRFYRRFSQIESNRFDAVIVTGAPVEKLAFEEVTYWAELKQLFDWAREHARSTFAVCWAGQAALNHFYGVPKHLSAEKYFGVFRHHVLRPDSPLVHGIVHDFPVPVSRHSEIRREDLPRDARLQILAESEETGLCLVADRTLHLICMFNHLEYDAGTLREEWLRDLSSGRAANPPANYFPNGNPKAKPINQWKPFAKRLFGNWLNILTQDSQTPARSMPRRDSRSMLELAS